MAQEVDTNFFINFIGKIKDGEKVVNEARKLGQEVQKAANMEGMTPQSKPVEQTAGAYEKLNQSVNAHNKVITELQKLQGGEQLAQKERLSVIREITTARAKGVIGENQFSEELKKTSTAYNDVNAASKKTLLTIARWAIGWTAVYSVMRGIKSAISSTVKDALALEQQIYRAISASRFERGGAMPTGSEIGQLRNIYTRELIDLVRGTSASIRDSGQALYFLSTAGLTAKESLAAMEPVLNLSIAAFGNLQEIARLTSGIYNVFGEQMQGFRTQQEAMTHIVDVLAYAYRNQQIEISEITTAMQFSAQMAGVMDIRFEDLIGTIGFLGTGMLRGSKAGTSLFNSFLQIADKSDMLRDKLGVVFDPSAPMDFVDIMEQLHNTFGDGAMSLGNMNLLFDVFGRRGGRAVAEILNRWDDWRESIRASKEEVAGTAEEMRKIVEESNIAQWKIFFNEIKSTLIEQLNPALKIMALSLGIINEKIKTTDYEKQFKAAKREVKEAISMMDGKGKSAMQALVFAGVDFAGGWTSVIASTRQWIKEMQEAGRITEDVANTLETGFVNNLKNLARMGNAPLTESALSREFEVAKLQAMKYQTILKQRAKTTKEVNDIDYSLVHTLEALRKERELNLLQAGGYNESMLAELKVSIALREGYADLLNAYNLRKQQLDEQPDLDIKLPNLPSFSEYSRAITGYQGAIEKSAESGERVWNNYRKSLIVTTKDGKKELYSLAGTAEDANKIISTLFGADIARMTQINTRLLQNYVNEVAKLNNRFQIQSDILKTLGADDVSLANFRLSHMDMLINRQQERVNILKKEKAGTILLQNAEQELFDLQLQRATAVGGTTVALINEQRTAYKEMYSELSSDFDIFYKKRELALKVAGADDRDLLLLARDRV
ncbi:MAG: phage tail tape measure protein, partial [Dehalococcoidales bacterium]|nr:phage tail tape measure protein [Dehalococcoidales bacterium]